MGVLYGRYIDSLLCVQTEKRDEFSVITSFECVYVCVGITLSFDFRIAGKLCAPVTTLIGLRWIIRNTEYLKKDQACIIVSNHQSSLDILGKPIVCVMFV